MLTNIHFKLMPMNIGYQNQFPKNPILGVEYAKQNYNQYVMCYPNLNPLGDCANFASQCMLAGGMHYQNDWKIYRKNNNYPQPANREQLDNSWNYAHQRQVHGLEVRESLELIGKMLDIIMQFKENMLMNIPKKWWILL